jgi:S-sulfo-L-cysteine synthase (O-acetyl-L-serine-dependent)
MSVWTAIGKTPLIELTHLNGNPKVRIFGKLDGSNPGGSVKDRPAYAMIAHAEATGELTHAKTILEATSGNTGIALAMIGAAKGYRVKLCMPECVSTERCHILEAHNADVVLTPAREGTDGAIRRAHQLLEQEPETYYMPNQYANEYNWRAHYATTGPEIFAQTNGAVDVFVAGMGTGGTLMGVSRYLKAQKPSVKIVGMEPTPGHTIQGLKNMTESTQPAIYDEVWLDEKLSIADGEAFEITRALATREGLFVGMSSGAAVAGALRIAGDLPAGSTIVAMLPDKGDRYLSTMLFRSVCAKCPP